VLIAQLSRLYRERGHYVEVHGLQDGGVIGDQLGQEGFPVFIHGPQSRWHVTRSLIRAFLHSRPNVVHCHNALVTNWVVPAALWARVPVIVSTRHGLVAPPYRWGRELQFVVVSRWLKAVVGVCQATTNNLAAIPWAARDRLITIYNGTAPAPQPATPLELPKRGFTLLYVGRLAVPKDFPTLLRALALVRAIRKDVFLWVVGEGELRPSVEKLCDELRLNDAVTLWGERADTGAFFDAADVFVLTSTSEGLPVSLLEAMAAGRPVVAAAPGAVPEIVEGGRCGFVVPIGSSEGVAEGILRLAGDSALCASKGEAARAHYLHYFTAERMADRYLEVYRTGK
jgi:glycosyltransferase involved in cell wall biosynthesis